MVLNSKSDRLTSMRLRQKDAVEPDKHLGLEFEAAPSVEHNIAGDYDALPDSQRLRSKDPTASSYDGPIAKGLTPRAKPPRAKIVPVPIRSVPEDFVEEPRGY